MRRHLFALLLVGVVIVGSRPLVWAQTATPQTPIVYAVMFHSPLCSFCRQIVEHDLPPLIAEFGDRLHLEVVNVDEQEGKQLYEAALRAFAVPRGAPMVFVGSEVLSGVNIPEKFPTLVREYLAQGGAAWPAIPGLEAYLIAHSGPTSLPTPTAMPTSPAASPASIALDTGQVRVVMFWLSSCPHCHEVIENVLPPLQRKYGGRLEIRLIEASQPEEVQLLYTVAAWYGVADHEVGVPFLVVGDRVFIGSTSIALELPELIEAYLGEGGVDWPPIPELRAYLAEHGLALESQPSFEVDDRLEPPEKTPKGLVLPSADFALAFLVFMGNLLSLPGALILAWEKPRRILLGRNRPTKVFVALCLIGLGVASYLSYVELTLSRAVCGPIGDCNAVQASPYARLWGFLPIGVLGMLGYLAIGFAWWLGCSLTHPLGCYARLAAFGMALFGVAFSAYLTYLEIFVIQAICLWCLTSALVMTLLLWLLGQEGGEALQSLLWQR